MDSELKNEHLNYLKQNPEIREMLSDLLSEILVIKPDNVNEFCRDYFIKREGIAKDGQTVTTTTITANDEKKEIDIVQDTMKITPLIIAGPSGVGKGTLIEKLRNEFDLHFGFSVSHTTRQPRDGEEHGVHYHFTSKDEMQLQIDNGDFIESANVHGNLYGTGVSQ